MFYCNTLVLQQRYTWTQQESVQVTVEVTLTFRSCLHQFQILWIFILKQI